MERSDETVEVMGVKLPKWQKCNRCGKEYACNFIDKIGYYQPCYDCRQTPEYRKELDQAIKAQRTTAKVKDSLEAKRPAAYHSTPWGTYLVTNKRGDVLREEKVNSPKAQRGQKAKMRGY